MVEPVVVQSADTPPTFLPLNVPVAEDVVIGRVVDGDLGNNHGHETNAGGVASEDVISEHVDGQVFDSVADDNPATE